MSMHNLVVVEGETMTILKAMRHATSRGWSNIVFESDSKVVVDAIQANHHGIAELSSIILSIKLLLQCNSNFEIKFTKRQVNVAAHTLAGAVISWSSRMFFNYVPRCIEPFIINEMS
ncbi:trypsin/chymotrypsin inhibitor [Trifolium pratense]|uniref:Trypsin/chymotrypsin inhibitor n=1 Tax=Trifolium pratense TaxID=57577 RepID=A0A2K3M831_TRIPR|nr:trypsin/chymotrypsin inhibitor [Trifolium pratense]